MYSFTNFSALGFLQFSLNVLRNAMLSTCHKLL